jgi:hypothetical protein
MHVLKINTATNTHLKKYNSKQVVNSCMFRHRVAIIRELFKTNEYKPNMQIIPMRIITRLVYWGCNPLF